MNNSRLLKELLFKKIPQIDKNHFPKEAKEWIAFFKLLQRHRLFFSKSNISILINYLNINFKGVIKTIHLLYKQASVNNRNYKKLKLRLRELATKTSTPLLIVKDLNGDNLYKYYGSLKPFKFDIDILGKYRDIPKIKNFIEEIGFKVHNHLYGWPNETIPQYKFPRFINNKLIYPKIELRYQAITISFSGKMDILNKAIIKNFINELWRNAQIKKGDFAKLPKEYLFVHLCLIYYFEDLCRGLNNLYRIWSFYTPEKDSLDWKKINDIAKRYHIINVLNFVLLLAKREFSLKRSGVLGGSTAMKLALRLIDLDFICRAYLPIDKQDFWRWKDGYIHFLTRGLLAEEPFWRKIIFFLHPKRLLFFIWGLIS